MTEQQLTKGERTVLKELASIGEEVPASVLSEKVQENEERVISILNSLAERDLVELTANEVVKLRLTEEGEDYATNWLPEVRLFGAVQELGGKASIDDAISKSGLDPKTKGIALSWARKNGWLGITKDEGVSILEAKVSEADSPIMRVIKKLNEGEQNLPEHLAEKVEVAVQRGLVIRQVTKIFVTNIVVGKSELISTLLSEVADGVVDLTPEMLSSGSWKEVTFRPYNVSVDPPYVNYGRKHPYAEFNDWLKEILVGLGFTEWFGPFVETELWNNDALFVPQDHVAREVQDQFRVTKPFDHGDIPDSRYFKQVKAVHEDGGDTGSIGWEAPF
ncbi:MAG: tRNA ligase subunit PheS family protein, partial [Candidatus Thorarchaeota archaeon]